MDNGLAKVWIVALVLLFSVFAFMYYEQASTAKEAIRHGLVQVRDENGVYHWGLPKKDK